MHLSILYDETLLADIKARAGAAFDLQLLTAQQYASRNPIYCLHRY
jgi:hypothetical protein